MKFLRRIFSLTLCLSVLAFTAHASTESAVQTTDGFRPVKEWTFLFYVAGDEDEIDPWERVSLRRLEQIGSDAQRWFIAHTDLHRDAAGKGMISEPAKRYELRKMGGPIQPKDFSTLEIKSPVVWSSRAETNSADPNELADFIQWGIAQYPARHYALFILTHSWGWRGLSQDFNPGFAIPASPPEAKLDYLMMSIAEFRNALERGLGGRKLDILGMDSCNSAVLEFAFEMSHLARFFAAAVTEMPFMGFTYDTTLSRRWLGAREFTKQLVRDTVASFSRSGNSTQLEGNYPAVSVLALDLEKMGPVWQEFGLLTRALPRSNFAKLFLGANNPLWQDPAGNADLLEVTATLARYSDRPAVRHHATRLWQLLGGYNPWPAPDTIPYTFSTAGGDRVRIVFQGDEHGDEQDRLKEASEAFEFLNTHLRSVSKSWKVQTQAGTRTYELSFPWKDSSVRVRPYVGGVSWVNVESWHKDKRLTVASLKQGRTYSLREHFPSFSPYLLQGHTFGAGRSQGLGINVDPTIDPARAEHWHWTSAGWLGGREYYRTISFSRFFGWAKLLFEP